MEHNERFEQIYDETRSDLLRYLMLRTNADPEAEDLMQDVYRKLYLRMTRGVLPILDPRLYLFAIAKKELSRYYRRAARRKQAELPLEEQADVAADEEPIDERLLVEERKDAVWALIQKEPEPNRRIFLLYYGYDRSQKEIGEALGLSEKAVRQRLHRTRNKIRALLESNGSEL